MKALALTLLLGSPALAETQSTPLNADQFAAYVQGTTLSWSSGNQLWGTEEYLPNRRVQWTDKQNESQISTWYPYGDQICFACEGAQRPACWIFRLGQTGLIPELQVGSGPLLLNQPAESTTGLPCPGTALGV
jgi:hypothetical protein